METEHNYLSEFSFQRIIAEWNIFIYIAFPKKRLLFGAI